MDYVMPTLNSFAKNSPLGNPPINGGPQYKALNYEQRRADILARMTLTEELGHSRVQITSYLG